MPRSLDTWPSANKNGAYYFEPLYGASNSFLGRMMQLPYDGTDTWGPTWNSGEDILHNGIFNDGGVTGGDPRTMASGKYLNDGYVFAFKLGGKAVMPRVAEKNALIPEQPAIEATAAQVENGKFRYGGTCMVCHGALVVSGGVIPDLRMLSAEKHSIFKEIVYDGVIHGAGMPRLGDLLTEQDVRDIHAYIVERSNQDRAAAAATSAAAPSR